MTEYHKMKEHVQCIPTYVLNKTIYDNIRFELTKKMETKLTHIKIVSVDENQVQIQIRNKPKVDFSNYVNTIHPSLKSFFLPLKEPYTFIYENVKLKKGATPITKKTKETIKPKTIINQSVICVNDYFEDKIKDLEYPIKGGIYKVLSIKRNGRFVELDGYQNEKVSSFEIWRFALWKGDLVESKPNGNSLNRNNYIGVRF